MHPLLTFEAVLHAEPKGGAYVLVPADVKALFGSARPKVVARFNGEASYRGTLVRYGAPEHMLIVLKSIREKLGLQPGDEIRVELAPDAEERVVEVPEELAAALLAAPEARGRYQKLSYTHQREHARYVAEAKQEATRLRRAQRVLELLMQ